MVIVGRDVVSGLPIAMEIGSKIVYEAMKSNLESICTSIKMILEKTPPEPVSYTHLDVYKRQPLMQTKSQETRSGNTLILFMTLSVSSQESPTSQPIRATLLPSGIL